MTLRYRAGRDACTASKSHRSSTCPTRRSPALEHHCSRGTGTSGRARSGIAPCPASTSPEAHVLSGSLRRTQSSHSSPSPPEHKKRPGGGGTATAAAARHCLLRAPHPQWTCSSLGSFAVAVMVKGASWAPEGQPPPQGTCSPRVSGLSLLFLYKWGNHAWCVSCHRPSRAGSKAAGQLGHQLSGEQQPHSQEVAAPQQSVVMRCSLQRSHRNTDRRVGRIQRRTANNCL